MQAINNTLVNRIKKLEQSNEVLTNALKTVAGTHETFVDLLRVLVGDEDFEKALKIVSEARRSGIVPTAIPQQDADSQNIADPSPAGESLGQ